ncbi:exosortase V [Leptolyngbya sp. 15MV]|nr:exosortase V [Leptolyngbya sp. 15MV]
MPFRLADLVLLVGLALVIIPTMIFVARETWSSEEGAHAPIVLMTGIWLIWTKWPSVREYVQPPAAWKVIPLVAALLAAYALARITQIAEIEGFVMYGAALACAYALTGGEVLRRLAFPLIYLAFAFPFPETLIYAITMPLKIAISESAIFLLKLFGYPIGGTGVTIQIGQYQLLVAAACSGLNSIVSLSALTTFYIYVRHSDNLRYAAILLLAVVPVAIAANFVRVLILILLTYHAGEAAAQGFMHDVAGLFMFATALLMIFLLDVVLQRIVARRGRATSERSVA